jgi:hypothetical protein
MISANLMGGLGNQMFQIMTAYAHSKEIGDDLYFDFDKCYTPNQGHTSSKYLPNLFKKLKNDKQENHFQFVYNETTFSYRPIPKEKNLRLNGVFQSEKYFDKYKSDIKQVFNLDESKMRDIRNHLEDICSSDIITAVHIRRGDYLSKPYFHTTPNTEYYNNCMELMGDSKFIIVSDDIEWCKNTFIRENVFFSDFTDELDDLYLIMMCNNKIMSNSSFSWWGSYLSPFDGKIFAPKNWFGPQGPQDTQDIYNKNWNII